MSKCMAIANQKEGQTELAQSFLRQALVLNPKGSFASSPERLNAFKAELSAKPAAAVAAVTPPAVAASEAAPTSVALADVAPAVMPAVSVAAATPTQVVEVAIPLAPPVVVEPQVRADKPSMSVGWREILLFVASLMVASLISSFLLALINRRMELKRKAKVAVLAGSEEPASATNPDPLLTLVRDESARLMQQLESGNATDSELYAALAKLLPVIEREAGRARYRTTGEAQALAQDDQQAVAALRQLEKVPLRLSEARPGDVAALFQSARRPI